MARTYESVFNTSARSQSATAETSVRRHVSTMRQTVASAPGAHDRRGYDGTSARKGTSAGAGRAPGCGVSARNRCESRGMSFLVRRMLRGVPLGKTKPHFRSEHASRQSAVSWMLDTLDPGVDIMITPTSDEARELIGLAERMGIPTEDAVRSVLQHLTNQELSEDRIDPRELASDSSHRRRAITKR